MFVQYLVEFIKAPTFAINSLYDVYGIGFILKIKCILKVSYSLKNCTNLQLIEI